MLELSNKTVRKYHITVQVCTGPYESIRLPFSYLKITVMQYCSHALMQLLETKKNA